MAMIRILDYPDPKLKRLGIRVVDFGPATQKIIDDMFETHYNTPHCAALAATQLDIPDAPHITVIDFSEANNEPLCLVNATVIQADQIISESEGCMSVYPETIQAPVKRASHIQVEAQDRFGNPLIFKAEGFMAKCIQHELDHLNGTLFIDHLSTLKRKLMDMKIAKIIREAQKK
jgi:peptide deformylase